MPHIRGIHPFTFDRTLHVAQFADRISELGSTHVAHGPPTQPATAIAET